MAATQNQPTTRPLVPPDDAFYKRYSPHHELPLASATSVFVHGLVIAILAFGGLAAYFFPAIEEASRPVKTDVVALEGLSGLDEGLGGPPGLPGPDGDGGPPSPFAADTSAQPPSSDDPSGPMLKDVQGAQLDLPQLPDGPGEPVDNVFGALDKLAQDASKEAKREPSAPRQPKPIMGSKAGGTDNPKGKGGLGGVGDGPGKGNKFGPGTGTGGLGGRKATTQEILAWRWRFDMTGNAREHANKLLAAGVIIAIPDPLGGKADFKKGPYLFVRDLKRRPVAFDKQDLAKYEDAVKWYNTRSESVRGLREELQFPFMPPWVVILLPKDREQQMAVEEKRFAERKAVNLADVQETWFDFRLQGGSYEPVAFKMVRRDKTEVTDR